MTRYALAFVAVLLVLLAAWLLAGVGPAARSALAGCIILAGVTAIGREVAR
jgi:hypothetical protein